MFRLFLLLNLLFSANYACEYTSCKQKIIDSQANHNKQLSIPVKKNVNLIYSQIAPNAKILKHDPFLSLYLVQKRNNFPYPFYINMFQNLDLAGVDKDGAKKGKIVSKQIGLNSLATFSKTLSSSKIIMTSCCSLEGIVTPHGIIEKEYLNRFINTSATTYADVGVRLKNQNGNVVVNASDPYAEVNKFKNGDIILNHNGKKVFNASKLMRDILFSKIGSIHRFTVKRASKLVAFSIKSFQRYGGGDISDTFLEQKGLFFDKNLMIIKINKESKIDGLELGDKLIQVDGIRVRNQEELRVYISDFHEFSSLLIARDGFEFFVNIK